MPTDPPVPPPELSAEQVRFCQCFHEHGNATQSYLDAGFRAAKRE